MMNLFLKLIICSKFAIFKSLKILFILNSQMTILSLIFFIFMGLYFYIKKTVIIKPLEDFDYFWKHLPLVESPYRKFALWAAYKLDFFIIHTNLFYFIFAILPRLLLILIFSIDIFWFSKLYYIYKFLFLGIFLFLNRYIIYSLKMLKKDLINDFKLNYLSDIWTDYEFGIHPSEYPENYDPNDPDNEEVQERMALPIEVFVDYYINNLVYKNKEISYSPAYNFQRSFYDKIYEEHNLKKTPYQFNISADIQKYYLKKTDSLIKIILDTAKVIEFYSFTNTQNKAFNYTKIFIFSSYLICWLYVLIISASADNVSEILNLLYKILFENIEEPFSGIFL